MSFNADSTIKWMEKASSIEAEIERVDLITAKSVGKSNKRLIQISTLYLLTFRTNDSLCYLAYAFDVRENKHDTHCVQYKYIVA